MLHRIARRWWVALLIVLIGWLALWESPLFSQQRYDSFITRTPLQPGEVLIIGFPGGREKWDNELQIARRIALRLRKRVPPGIHIETVENKQRHLAIRLVKESFDYNRDGTLDARECASARVILYGQSFGGAAVVKAANELETLGIPVMLTVQVDSVGIGDEEIPPNVARAANLYQDEGLFIRGEGEIRASDSARTQILGNFRYSYRGKEVDLSSRPWWKRLARVTHTKMEFDPEVWAKIEELILAELEAAQQLTAEGRNAQRP